MFLGFHWVCAGIGFKDPKYIGQNPDRRLASWGSGTVENAIDEKATEIRFKPAPGVYAPYDVKSLRQSSLFAPGLYGEHKIMRIENELVRFREMKNVEQATWTLTNCERGFGSTKAAPHAAGADAAGLLVPYAQNFIPDNWSTLLPEVTKDYARLLNRTGVSHVEFDGLEIHIYYGCDGNKMAEMLYSELDHPTISGSSSGRPPDAWLEYRFLKTKPTPYGQAIVRLRSVSQNASSLLMADFALARPALLGSPRLDILSGDRGFYPAAFAKHGLGPKILERMKMWREIARSITPEDQKQINYGAFRAPNSKLSQAGNHNEVPVVYVPEPCEGGWNLYPTAVMDQGEQNSPWYWGQENGPIEPWRFAKANSEELYTNPFPEQPLRFVLHVLAATDYENPENYAVPLSAAAMKQTGDTKFSDNANALQLNLQNPRDKEAWNVELPVLSQKFPSDWSSHRPIGLFVEGDGKNEVFVIMPKGRPRDYAIPITFTGKRYIEIPHGEAAYALKSWGWRFATSKGNNYAGIGSLSLGFGYMPAKASAEIKVSGLKALKEIPTPLQNPTIVTVRGELQVKGDVPFDHYLEYQGGNTATLYDENWNKIADLPVTLKGQFAVPVGKSAITVKTTRPGSVPWIEAQFLTRGTPVSIKKKSN